MRWMDFINEALPISFQDPSKAVDDWTFWRTLINVRSNLTAFNVWTDTQKPRVKFLTALCINCQLINSQAPAQIVDSLTNKTCAVIQTHTHIYTHYIGLLAPRLSHTQWVHDFLKCIYISSSLCVCLCVHARMNVVISVHLPNESKFSCFWQNEPCSMKIYATAHLFFLKALQASLFLLWGHGTFGLHLLK